MERKYVATSPRFEGEWCFTYEDERLISFTSTAQLSPDQTEWLSRNFPTTHERLVLSIRNTHVTCRLVELDLSFDNFWETYNYKVDKREAQRVYDKLSEVDKVAIFESLPAYDYYLRLNPTIQKIYPVRFISKQRWEVPYVKMIGKK